MQKFIKIIRVTCFIGCSLLFLNCIDPFEVEATEFNSALVIEGTITDQVETQRILVSRTFPLDTILMTGLSSAQVNVVDSDGGVFSFSEETTGVYESTSPFAAIQGVTYTLKVETADGKSYTSEETTVPAKTSVDNLYAERDFIDGGAEEGMFIYVDSYDSSGQSKYYRYEYEETYKIIAPFWSALDAYIVSPLPSPEVDTRIKTREEQVAYNTVASNSIIQENTTGLGEDRVNKFPVRFINRENFILSHRYSILVKQFVQNRAAYAYYETLQLLSGTESLFSQRQSGFLEGNIKSDTNAEEDVVGFFQVSTVTEKRIFFNYTDFFPGESLPKYPVDCFLVSPPIITEGGSSPLLTAIELNTLKYVDDYDQAENPNNLSESGPFLMVATPCGDSTFFGSNIVPEFWIE
tara:strand:- start:32050 stop:33273 length:1224 start_codon:yes stop_codon:yes gene_type:complete